MSALAGDPLRARKYFRNIFPRSEKLGKQRLATLVRFFSAVAGLAESRGLICVFGRATPASARHLESFRSISPYAAPVRPIRLLSSRA